jgi:ABC-type Co2+ transport system permease subunit
MSDLERRPGSRMSRRAREQRAYRLVLATGTFSTLFVAALVLSILGVVGGSWVVLMAILAVVCGVLLRRTLRS